MSHNVLAPPGLPRWQATTPLTDSGNLSTIYSRSFFQVTTLGWDESQTCLDGTCDVFVPAFFR